MGSNESINKLSDLPSIQGSCTYKLDGSKIIRLLLIQPNCSSKITSNCLKMVDGYLPPDTIVYGYTGPPGKSPISIESHLDSIISSSECIRDAYNLIEEADCILVACFSDHPLINCIREEFDKPVCGIMEAAVYSARLIGGRFGVVCSVYRSQLRHHDAIKSWGLDEFCAGFLSTGLKVCELESKPRDQVLKSMEKVALNLVIDSHADVILLGCAGMTDMKLAIEKAVSMYGVEVIDGVVAGVNLISGIFRSGVKTSKRGLFNSSKEGRTSRGQSWL